MISRKARACVRLVRVVNSLMVGLAVIVGLVIVLGRNVASLGTGRLIMAYMTGFFISGASMVLNDIVDVEIDRVNAPDRPIASGVITVREAWACHLTLAFLGLASSAPLGIWPLIVALAGWLLGVAYDLWGKRSGFPGNLMVALATSLPFPYALAVAGVVERRILVYWAMVFLTVLGREIVKDIADVEGDREAGVRSLPIIWGARRSALLAAAFYLVAVALSPLPLIWGDVNPLAYAPLVVIVDAILVWESVGIILDPSRERALKSKKRVLWGMLIGLIAFLTAGLVGR